MFDFFLRKTAEVLILLPNFWVYTSVSSKSKKDILYLWAYGRKWELFSASEIRIDHAIRFRKCSK